MKNYLYLLIFSASIVGCHFQNEQQINYEEELDVAAFILLRETNSRIILTIQENKELYAPNRRAKVDSIEKMMWEMEERLDRIAPVFSNQKVAENYFLDYRDILYQTMNQRWSKWMVATADSLEYIASKNRINYYLDNFDETLLRKLVLEMTFLQNKILSRLIYEVNIDNYSCDLLRIHHGQDTLSLHDSYDIVLIGRGLVPYLRDVKYEVLDIKINGQKKDIPYEFKNVITAGVFSISTPELGKYEVETRVSFIPDNADSPLSTSDHKFVFWVVEK